MELQSKPPDGAIEAVQTCTLPLCVQLLQYNQCGQNPVIFSISFVTVFTALKVIGNICISFLFT